MKRKAIMSTQPLQYACFEGFLSIFHWLVVFLVALALAACGSSQGDGNDGDVAQSDSGQTVIYEGSFAVKVLNSHPRVLNPLLLLVEANNSSGGDMPEYSGRVKVSTDEILNHRGEPASFTYVVAYDEWGNRPEKGKGSIGGFKGGRNIIAITLVSIHQDSPWYDVTLSIEEAANPSMSGSVKFRAQSEPADKMEYTEIGRDYNPTPLIAGEPGKFNLVARSGRNTQGIEVQDTTRGEMQFFTNGPGTVSPTSIQDYSKKADEYGKYSTDFTFTAYGLHMLSTLWKTVFGMARVSTGGPFAVAPPVRILTFQKADLGQMSPVVDTWASPWGTFVAFEFGSLFVTKDGATSWELVKKFDGGLAAVGARTGYSQTSYNVCVITAGDILCDCPTDCMEWKAKLGHDDLALCLPGHPNKDMTCGIDKQMSYKRDIILKPSWGGHSYHSVLNTSGDLPTDGYLAAECAAIISNPRLTFPWALAEDRTMRTVYWADRMKPKIHFTIDHGQTWGETESNLPDDGISSMAFDQRFRLLYVGTEASGVWVASIDSVEE